MQVIKTLAESRVLTNSAGKKLHNPTLFIFPRSSFERSAATNVKDLPLPNVHLEGLTFSFVLWSCCCSQCTSERRINGFWQGLSPLVIPLLRLSTPLKSKASLVLAMEREPPTSFQLRLGYHLISPHLPTSRTLS